MRDILARHSQDRFRSSVEVSQMSLAEPFQTPEQYLDAEEQAAERSEYLDGRTFLMAGGSPQHNLLITSLVRDLGNSFRQRPCVVFSSDQRIKVSATGLYTYPDVVALCGDMQLEKTTLLNPQLLIEVLSDTTAAYDRGEKFAHYRRVESVQDYVLVSQDEVLVEHFTRQPGGLWLYSASSDPCDALRLPGLGVEIALADIYDKVTFAPDPPLR
jgi:Uma2 family endonuclease